MIKQQIKNALAIVKQMHNGEWEFRGHYDQLCGKFKCFRASRNNISIWLANGGWWCSIENEPWQLGYLGGWVVWVLAGRKYAKEFERKMLKQPNDLTQ